MPDEHTAAREHALAQEIAAPRDALPGDPTAQIAAPEFPIARRGYDKGAVDAYVRRVNQIVRELAAQRSPREAIRQALDRVGEETSDILRRAHETAEEITSKSRSEAEDRLQVARDEAAALLAAAKDKVARLDNDADLVWQERARILADVRRLSESLQGIASEADDRLPPEVTTGQTTEPVAELPPAEDELEPDDAEITQRLPDDLAAEEPLPGESEEEAGEAEPELAVEDDPEATREMSATELREELDADEDEPGAPPRST
jgi:DivIVA domain-containing protein